MWIGREEPVGDSAWAAGSLMDSGDGRTQRGGSDECGASYRASGDFCTESASHHWPYLARDVDGAPSALALTPIYLRWERNVMIKEQLQKGGNVCYR